MSVTSRGAATTWDTLPGDACPQPGGDRVTGRMVRSDLTVAQARQAHRLGILADVLDVLRLNERCETCGEVPGSIECRSTHKPKKAKRAARQPWEAAA